MPVIMMLRPRFDDLKQDIFCNDYYIMNKSVFMIFSYVRMIASKLASCSLRFHYMALLKKSQSLRLILQPIFTTKMLVTHLIKDCM